MKKLIEGDDRSAVAFLNYSVKVAPNPMVPMGPTAMGEEVWPVSVSEDGKRVGFSFIAPREVL